jgi:hypothetical protein
MRLLYYYILNITPLILIAIFMSSSMLPNWLNIVLLILYLVIYRPIIDRKRLIFIGVITEKDGLWKIYNIIPGLISKNFKRVFLG